MNIATLLAQSRTPEVMHNVGDHVIRCKVRTQVMHNVEDHANGACTSKNPSREEHRTGGSTPRRHGYRLATRYVFGKAQLGQNTKL